MPGLLVIGYGNPLRSDDGFGPRVAEELRQLCLGEDTEVIICQQLGPELAEAISRSRLVLFLDAARNAGPPGQLGITMVRASSDHDGPNTHHLTPAALLRCALTLYGTQPEAIILTASGESFDFGDSLSPSVAQSVPIAAARIRTILAEENLSQGAAR
jgi:hydrogenase maturation protease